MTQRHIAAVLVLGLGLSAPAMPSAAQVGEEGQVEGIIRSADSGMPLAGATVMVVSTPGRGAITHGDGSFRIAVPDAERYRLRIDRLGYAAATVEVEGGEPVAVDIKPYAPERLRRVAVVDARHRADQLAARAAA